MAKLTTQIAPRSTKGQNACTWVEMIERLLFDRVDTEPCAATVCIEHHLVALDFAHEAKATIAFFHFALPRAQIANDSIGTLVAMPPFSEMNCTHVAICFLE